MVKLQLVENSRPCQVVDCVKCRCVKPTVTMPQRLSLAPHGRVATPFHQ